MYTAVFFHLLLRSSPTTSPMAMASNVERAMIITIVVGTKDQNWYDLSKAIDSIKFKNIAFTLMCFVLIPQ
jgi:hypothetical protein